MSHYKPDPNKSVSLTIDGKPVTVPEGTRILEAARKVNVRIPTLCDHPDLCKRAVCRICVVECDGRGKLLAACANDVWEGVKVVTNNLRILNIRKTIVELLLANHPQECLSCARSGTCELQTLAADFGIRESHFRHEAPNRRPPVTEGKVLVRDMGKCIKCGRCVEACQEVQSVRAINSSHRGVHYEISAPYGQSLADGPCVFCGYCAQVCPVGAIYEYDQTAEAWAALNDTKRQTAALISPALGKALAGSLGLAAGSLNPGKMATALKRLGFDKVFNADYFTGIAAEEEGRELSERIKNNGKLPMIKSCLPGFIDFIDADYPDLADHLCTVTSPGQMFTTLIRTRYPNTTGVSIVPCLAKKFKARRGETRSQDSCDADLALTVRELVRMLKPAGIDIAGLPETPFDGIEPEQAAGCCSPGSKEGIKAKTLIAHSLADARVILDSIRKGECDADAVEILCPGADEHVCKQTIIYNNGE